MDAGRGRGTIAAAARVRPDGDGGVLLDDYAEEPIGLINITLIMMRSVWNYAFGIPMVVLFGASNPEIWRPWKTLAETLVGSRGIGSISTDDVMTVLKRAA
jgi:hypothetical protein